VDPKGTEQEDVNRINLAENRDKLWALLNVVMQRSVP
jgi:hypothetical protein